MERKRPQKGIEKKGIHHRHFVNYKGIAFERIFFVSAENGGKFISGIINFQKSVNRLRFVTGEFGKTLCCPSGWRGKHNFVALLFKKLYKRVKSCGLTGSGTACKNKNVVLNSVF